MFKLKNQFKIISFCLFVLLGMLFINNNKKIYAFPAIDLDARRQELEADMIDLRTRLDNVFFDRSIDSETRMRRMVAIENTMNETQDQLFSINRQIIERDRFNQENLNNSNQNNNSRRR
ncbi:effector protein [Candidatus Phytoplasma phoenicium]|uniref:Effector protein n=1 Tax=Candidatus Phytoplasma phoenicium TaxID=198422 RepID=A0A2S8NU71_9MOLU|nr:effector protein [Candidatus Phytoplasma phoenicium]